MKFLLRDLYKQKAVCYPQLRYLPDLIIESYETSPRPLDCQTNFVQIVIACTIG
jgi:hypothetical protein